MRVGLVGPSRGSGLQRAAVHVVRALSWAAPAVCVALAAQTGGIARWALCAAAVALGAVAWTYRRFLGDYALALSVAPGGSLEMTADHLILRHAGVLATDIAVPWTVVRAVSIDAGTQPAPAGSAGPAGRFPLPAEEGGRRRALFSPGRRRGGGGVPLLAASPVLPNVLVLVEPPAEVPWRYPFIAGPFNPPWGGAWPARPWPGPALTPALLLAVAEPAALAAAMANHAPVRDLSAADVRYLTAGGLLD
ncbi:MAG: hypothetical protein ACR2MO_03865 [Acidimicrobiales bacterium]